MKHQLSSLSVSRPAKIILVAALLLVLMVTAVIVSLGGQRPNTTQLRSTGGLNDTPAAQTELAEKQKFSATLTRVETSEEEIPYETTQTYDNLLPKDSTIVRVEGSSGKKVIRTEVKIKDGQEVSRSLISEQVTVPPVMRVIAIGTKPVQPNKTSAGENCDKKAAGSDQTHSTPNDCKSDPAIETDQENE